MNAPAHPVSCLAAPDLQERAAELAAHALSPAQVGAWNACPTLARSFHVVGSLGGRYDVHDWPYYNIAGAILDMCVDFTGDLRYARHIADCDDEPTLPMWDLLVAQKLLIETDEHRFRTLANYRARASRGHDHPARGVVAERLDQCLPVEPAAKAIVESAYADLGLRQRNEPG